MNTESTNSLQKSTIPYLPENVRRLRKLAVELRKGIKEMPQEERSLLGEFGLNKRRREITAQFLYVFVRSCNKASELLAKRADRSLE